MSLKCSAVTIDPGYLIKPQFVVEIQDKLNPLKVSFDKISADIIGKHDAKAERQDVDPLYRVASNIVNNSAQIAEFLDSKRPRTVELVPEDPKSTFMPPFSTLKEIACQMTCKSFNASTAHETITGILGKLKSYTWDAKAVIALAAFALDYGESLQLSLMQSAKQSSLELHVFRLGAVEKDKPTQPVTQLKSLVEITLQLIQKIIALEKEIAENKSILKEVPGLSEVKREIYTYWAIFALACASQITELEKDLKSEVFPKINAVFLEIASVLEKIEKYKEEQKLYNWAVGVVRNPSGIVVLLKALIFLDDVEKLDILDSSTKMVVSPEVIKKQNLLLFISGLDNIEDDIWKLKSIDEELKKDKEKQDYRILWIPVVDKWSQEAKEKFENLKSQMPWYVAQYSESFGGLKLIKNELYYKNKPIVVVTNSRGEIINKNAMYTIILWGIKAFPFRPEDEIKLSEHWNWLWSQAKKIHPDIEKWINEHKYIFLYGGVDTSITDMLATYLDKIRKDPMIKKADVSIEHFNLGKIDINIASKFWDNIINLFHSHVSIDNDDVIEDIERVLSKKDAKAWVLVSEGQNVLAIDCEPLMTKVLADFENWTKDVIEKGGFDKAFLEYYGKKRSISPPDCSHFLLVNIRSRIRMDLLCPDCNLEMEVESVRFNCCHGNHHHHHDAANFQENGSITAIPHSPYKLK